MEEGERLTRRWFGEIWNEGRLETIDELAEPDALFHGLGPGQGVVQGRRAFTAFCRQFRGAFPDLRIEVERLLSDGDLVMCSFRATGTHTGDGLGMPPTGRCVDIRFQSWARHRGGRFFEASSSIDFMGLMAQLGAAPAGSPPAADPAGASAADEVKRNKGLVHRWFEEVWHQGRSDTIDELVMPDAAAPGLLPDPSLSARDIIRQLQAQLLGSFPDLQITIEDLIGEGDRTAARLRLQGTHLGDGLGIPPTGKRVDFTAMTFAHWRDGQMVNAWNNADFAGMMQQLQGGS